MPRRGAKVCLPWLFRFVPAAVVPRSCLGRRHFFLLSPFGQRLQSFIFLCHPIPPGCLPADGGHICLADFVMCFRRICRVAQCIEAQRVATAACCSRKTACSALPNGRFCIAERASLHPRSVRSASCHAFCRERIPGPRQPGRDKRRRNVLPSGAKIISLHGARRGRQHAFVAAGA